MISLPAGLPAGTHVHVYYSEVDWEVCAAQRRLGRHDPGEVFH